MEPSVLFASPRIQQPTPITPVGDAEKLPPFVMPPVGKDTPKPRVLGLRSRIRGKRSPVFNLVLGGQDFVQYRLPSSHSLPGTNPHHVRANLPVVLLTDKQVEALHARSKLERWGDVFQPPASDPDALTGFHEGTVDELIVIADYIEGGDPFALAHAAQQAAASVAAALDPKPPKLADEIATAERDIRDLNTNGEPQREPARGAAKKH